MKRDRNDSKGRMKVFFRQTLKAMVSPLFDQVSFSPNL